MLTSEQLKNIRREARPLIEQQLELAEKIAGFRELVSSHGGDWGQLKALIKAQIQDENDDEGDGKRVRKILDKADYANAYADMLGLANMNEKNSFADDEDNDPDDGEVEPGIEPVGGEGAQPPAGQSQPATDPNPVAAAVEAQPLDTAKEGVRAVATAPSATHHPQPEQAGLPEATASGENSVIHPEPDGGEAGVSPVTAGAPATGEGAHNPTSPVVAFKLSDKPLRPLCQNPDHCGGYGRKHCYRCERAHEQRIPVEPGGVEIPHGGEVA